MKCPHFLTNNFNLFIKNYESEKELVYDSVKADLDEKILRLEEDKNNVDINNGLWELSARRNRKRQVRFFPYRFETD